MRDKTLLLQLQALPLDAKILMSQQRIREWYNHFNGDVMISFSGGKDSTVLAHLVHSMYPNVPLVFANTGLEYPEIQAFAKKMGAEFVRPKMRFDEVITKYGYPIISKEVAEAIHAARFIVPTSHCIDDSGEREPSPWADQKRDDLLGVPRRYKKPADDETGQGAEQAAPPPLQHSRAYRTDQKASFQALHQARQRSQRKAATTRTTGRTGDAKACSG